MAEEAKSRGNKAFAAKKYDEAIVEFTKAIEIDPKGHVYYSNRSACYAAQAKYEEALSDADKCIEINPNFIKGYIRKAIALSSLSRVDDAMKAYEDGLKVDPNNETLKKGQASLREGATKNALGAIFGPQMWNRLYSDPKTAKLLLDPEVVKKVQLLQTNPIQNLQMFQNDPQMMEIMSVILGIPMQNPPSTETQQEPDKEMRDAYPEASEQPKAEPKESKTEPLGNKANNDALEEKNIGNQFYSQKKFKEALEHYNRAHELDLTNPAYLTNRAAANFELGEYDACIADCKEAIKTAHENSTSKTFEWVGKAYHRIGNALLKQKKVDEAIEAYQSSLLEVQNKLVKKALQDAQSMKKKMADEAYLNPEIAEEEKKKGDVFFREGKWNDAINSYSEALKRKPDFIAVFSNRAAAYTKLMDWQKALADCDACMKLDPNFWKCYLRKGKIEHLMKRYDKAIEAYEAGLKVSPGNELLIQGRMTTMNAIQTSNTQAPDEERVKNALNDPEIQQILMDPMMKKVLEDMSTDPRAARNYMQDPQIVKKIEKLIAAGVLKTA